MMSTINNLEIYTILSKNITAQLKSTTVQFAI